MPYNKRYNHQTSEWEIMAQVHPSTFEYLKPTDKQLEAMQSVRSACAMFAGALDAALPPGPDKTFIFRTLRDLAMWSNVCVMRHADGAPRIDEDKP